MSISDEFFRNITLSDLTLRVGELEHVGAFYRDVLGFVAVSAAPARIGFSFAANAPASLVLEAAPDAPRRPPASAGLFHAAWLLPDRASLGRMAQHLQTLGVPFGEADHGVSEALYLEDPEGNGIELYADRPADVWPRSRAPEQVAMFTAPLDRSALIALGRQNPGPVMPGATRLGHVHLSVTDLKAAREFYADVLAFPVRQQNHPGALFYGRDGYHHHLATNTWRSRRPVLAGSRGLVKFSLGFSSAAESVAVIDRARANDCLVSANPDIAILRDPDGIEIAVHSSQTRLLA
jgi:catechol 2,3-dioxygenase